MRHIHSGLCQLTSLTSTPALSLLSHHRWKSTGRIYWASSFWATRRGVTVSMTERSLVCIDMIRPGPASERLTRRRRTLSAVVLSVSSPIKRDVTQLNWGGCHMFINLQPPYFNLLLGNKVRKWCWTISDYLTWDKTGFLKLVWILRQEVCVIRPPGDLRQLVDFTSDILNLRIMI